MISDSTLPRRFALGAVLAMAAGSALAEEAHKPSGGQYVDLAPVALPVVVDGRLINYVFVSARINLSSSANGPHLQEKEPYFRDALVRAGHRAPYFTRFDDYTRLDEAKLKASLFAAATAIAGAGQVTSITFTAESQPQRRAGLPRPKLAPAR